MGCICEKSIKVKEYKNIKSVKKEDELAYKNKDLNNNTKKKNKENRDLLYLRKKESNNENKESLSNGKINEQQIQINKMENEISIMLHNNSKDKNTLKNKETTYNEDKIKTDKDKELLVIKGINIIYENNLEENKEKDGNDQINQKGEKIGKYINQNDNSKKEIVNMSDEKKENLHENQVKEKEEIKFDLEAKNNEMNSGDNENPLKNETKEEKNLQNKDDIQNFIINENPHNQENIFQELNIIKEKEIKLKENKMKEKNITLINENNDILVLEQNITENKKGLNEEEKEKQEINIEKNEDNIDEIYKNNKKEEDYNIVNCEQNKPKNNLTNIDVKINEENPKEKYLDENINKNSYNQMNDNNKIQKEENIIKEKQENLEEMKIFNKENKEENDEENKVDNIVEKMEEKEEENIKNKEEEQKEKNINDDRKGQENNVNKIEEQKENSEEKNEEKKEEINYKDKKIEKRNDQKTEEEKEIENIEKNKGEKMEEKMENIEEKKIEENIEEKKHDENNKENIEEEKKQENINKKMEENTKENNGNKEEEKMREENDKEKEERKKEKNIYNENTTLKNEKETRKENKKSNEIKSMEEANLFQNIIIPLKENGNELNQINVDKDNKNSIDNTENNDINQYKINNLEENNNNKDDVNKINQEKLDITEKNKDDNIQKNTYEEKENLDIIENENQYYKEKEKETILKEDDEILTSHEHEEIIQQLNTDNLKNIAKKSPKRTKSKLADLINYLKKSINKMNEFEKGYVIFYWIHENIEYANDKKRDRSEERLTEIYKIGKCVCEGYSKLYEYIGKQLGLKVYYISGYVEDNDYKDKYEAHAWNVLEVDKKYYLIDATWGAGYSENNKYIKRFDEFYFCSNPEYFIFTHFPKESKWQLLKSPIGNEDFENRVKFKAKFFEYFKGSSVLYNLIITKNEYIFRLYKKKINFDIRAEIWIHRSNYYTTNNDCQTIIDENENYIDIKCIFTEKNSYKVKILVKIGETEYLEDGFYIKRYQNLTTFKVEYLDEAEKQFKYGEINNNKSKPLEHDEIIANLNKEKIKSIINKAPNRKNSTLNDFIQYLKNETKDLTDFEKAYSLFFWVFKNISYGFCKLNHDNLYESIYKEEKLNISFSKTFSYILKNIGLNIFEIDGFTKTSSNYHDSGLIFGSNSSWNIIEIKGSYYIIFPSLYILYFKEEKLIDFYFCAKPENFIWSFLPKVPKWQLLEKSITKEDFQKRVKLEHLFFNYFYSIDPIYLTITVEKRFTVKLNKKNQQNKIYCTIMGLESKNNKSDSRPIYLENLNCKCMVIDKEDQKEIKCIFKKTGKFILLIRANDGSSNSYLEIAELHFECISCLNNKEFNFFREDYNERKKSKNDSLKKPNINIFSGVYILENYNVG